jgi:dTDP-4-amino-4,6-dideoxygalactose transaminase
VAFPGYACVDLAAAAAYSRVRVSLYDLDPVTLSPDLESVSRALHNGARAIVVAHLYGYPADVPGVAALAEEAGVPVIEDAAQSAWGQLNGRPLGSLAPLRLLSFGRGKGLTGGRGGALLASGAKYADVVFRVAAGLGHAGRGGGPLAGAAAQWALGRPWLYGLPASIPQLQLGEMVHHEAHEPRALSTGAASLVLAALRSAAASRAKRAARAGELTAAIEKSEGLQNITTLPGAVSGYLRLPVLVRDGRAPAPRLGIQPGYPRTLHEQPEMRPLLIDGQEEQQGALELRKTLVTLPVHERMSARDMERVKLWIRGL